jgi:hypothetical protein
MVSRPQALQTCSDPERPPGERRTFVVGELAFDAPVCAEKLAALERACSWCFEAHRVCLIERFLARSRMRAVLVFLAPDAESVRQACRHIGIQLDRVWASSDAERHQPGG